MKNLLRKIRQKLLDEGNLKKYFIYAVGEILLVVVGILIALQINNWQHDINNKKLEKHFFNDIKVELKKDSARLNFLTNYYNNRIENLGWLLDALRNPDKIYNNSEIGMHLEPLYYGIPSIHYTATYESAKSSGHFNRFSSSKNIKRLTQYYADGILLDNILSATSKIIINQFEPIMLKYPLNYFDAKTASNVLNIFRNGDFYNYIDTLKDNRKNRTSIKNVLKDKRFESYLFGDLGRAFHALSIIKERQVKLNSILAEIKNIDTKE